MTIYRPANPHMPRRRRRGVASLVLLAALAGCSSFGASGPSGGNIRGAARQSYAGSGITILELDGAAVQRLVRNNARNSFAEGFGDADLAGVTIGRGDVLDVQVWEAPPAVLFSNAATGYPAGLTPPGAQISLIPPQIVDLDGTIDFPFAGRVNVAGRTPGAIEREIANRLAGKANNPQVVVRLVQNDARTITVLGEVIASRRVPLGPKGERLLDALASAGGPRHPVGKTTVRITRGESSLSMPLDAVIRNPAQNIRLQAGDLLTVLHQPFSFVALGAVQRAAEVPFEGSGFTLAEAMGRIGGLRDDRADIRGVFIFRLEDPAAMDQTLAATARRTEQGRIPVIYRLNMSDAASFFIAQDFQVRDKDVLYVSSAPGADFQRFISTISSLAFSTITITDAINVGGAR